ncbi:FeoA family protein [Enterococcus sp. AZ109]|uniref:FeoA family protein n=1 Tax=Enterococcus sp. AZ109 TaxID=2774634 RepID=UPI003F22EDBA
MTTLAETPLNKVVQIENIQLDAELKRRMQDLGMTVGTKVAVVNHSDDNSIVLLHNARVALDQSLLMKIVVNEVIEEQRAWVSLDQLAVGDTGQIVTVHGTGAVKRRLMDMGLTKGTEVKVVKLAPLGDPMEIRVRGYELSLRKNESEMVVVAREAR